VLADHVGTTLIASFEQKYFSLAASLDHVEVLVRVVNASIARAVADQDEDLNLASAPHGGHFAHSNEAGLAQKNYASRIDVVSPTTRLLRQSN
jgi:hypothetical protein